MDAFVFLMHMVALLVVVPLLGVFGGCRSVCAFFGKFAECRELEKIGIVAACIMVFWTAWEIIAPLVAFAQAHMP